MWIIFFMGIGLGLLVPLAGQFLRSLSAPRSTARIKPEMLTLGSLLWFLLAGALLPSARTSSESHWPSAQQCH